MNYYLLLTRNALIGSMLYYTTLKCIRNYYYSRQDFSVFFKTIIDHMLTRNVFINEGLIFGLIVGRYIK